MTPRKVTYSRRSTHAARAAHAKGEKQFRTYDTSAIQPQEIKKTFGSCVGGTAHYYHCSSSFVCEC